ncbi:hypothetical protein YC2023_083351 [Brassica napus]
MVRRLPDDFQEVFQTTFMKSSDGVFNQMVLIFHLDMYFVCVYKNFSDLSLIYMFFRSRSNFARPMGSLLGSLPDDFKEVFQTTSRKSSRRLPGSLSKKSSRRLKKT